MKLIPKTHKAKNKIREAGTDEWEIVSEEPSVICLDGKPGMLIQPPGQPMKARWVLTKDDPDFDFV